MKKQGFTLVEIMIVVLIIGLLAAIAIPNFLKARTTTQRNACIDNLRAIQGAVEQAKMEGLANVTDIYGADKYIKAAPSCPVNKAAYDLTGADAADWVPVCPNVGTYPEHALPTGVGS